LYPAESIINWRTASISNQKSLVLLVLQEEAVLPGDNEFEQICETQWRVLDLVEGKYRQRLFHLDKVGKQEQIGDDVYPMINNTFMDFIPFYFIGVDDTDSDVDEPPLIDLVDVNLAHYRTTADYEHGCHFTGLPQPVVTGVTPSPEDPPLTIGSSKAWVLPNPQSTATYLALDSGFTALENNLKKKEHMMATLGARMLEEQPRAVETAETARLHSAGESSMLASIARSISTGIERALQTFSVWAGAAGDVGFQINRDFVPAKMQPQELTALVAAWQQGAYSKETLFINLQKGELIADEVTFEEEQARVEEEQALSDTRQLNAALVQLQAQADLEAGNQTGNQPGNRSGNQE
jgi:Domain of unknown function (DUF4055)